MSGLLLSRPSKSQESSRMIRMKRLRVNSKRLLVTPVLHLLNCIHFTMTQESTVNAVVFTLALMIFIPQDHENAIQHSPLVLPQFCKIIFSQMCCQVLRKDGKRTLLCDCSSVGRIDLSILTLFIVLFHRLSCRLIRQTNHPIAQKAVKHPFYN